MDEYGLYENWYLTLLSRNTKTCITRDPKFNKSLDSGGLFILASRNFPTGARSWFPCFDEMEKKVINNHNIVI